MIKMNDLGPFGFMRESKNCQVQVNNGHLSCSQVNNDLLMHSEWEISSSFTQLLGALRY